LLKEFLADVLDSKFINHKTEVYGAGLILAWHGGRLDVDLIFEVNYYVLIGKVSGLRKSVHAFVYFIVDKVIDSNVIQAIVA
jgi:hypothetical protein